jgi:hypothetical protein
MADIMADFMNQFSAKGMPTILIIGGVVAAFLLPSAVGKNLAPLVTGAGYLALGAGIYSMITTPPLTGSKALAGFPMEVKNTRYSSPVNNLKKVNPRNRFDKQTNFVLPPSKYNSYDNYVNDTIMDEIKNLGLDNSIGNYPVRANPWEVKSLIPTTQIDPIRDSNTVRYLIGETT